MGVHGPTTDPATCLRALPDPALDTPEQHAYRVECQANALIAALHTMGHLIPFVEPGQFTPAAATHGLHAQAAAVTHAGQHPARRGAGCAETPSPSAVPLEVA